ncbi:hypothetical protein DRW48_12730 [Paracoccus suum]|uniref:DUF2501 domain-containing protein n=2 Tax=Paracoccus suum TaxID=2259340 RepID=A0A344PPH0_9RHOB|nr:hypothetical protein DRW48_12730 [Paracoccus suum]
MIFRASVIAGLVAGGLVGTGAMAQDAAPATPPAAAPTTTEAHAAPAATAEAPAPSAIPGNIDPAAAYASARNQLGVLNYCKDKGWIAGDALAVQEKMIGMMPPGDTAAGDAAEAKGKTGTVSAMGTEMTLADGAQKQSTTEEALCKQMETMLKELGAQLPG